MKSIIRALSIALVLALLPVAAFAQADAEAPKFTTLTMNNIEVAINGETYPIGIEAVCTLGADEDRFYFAGDVATGAIPVVSFKAAGEDDVVKLALNGLSENYEIGMEELQAILEGATSAQADGMPVDREQIQELFTAYIDALQASANAQTNSGSSLAENVEMLKQIGIEAEPVQESVEVMGEAMTLSRLDAKLGLEELDKMLDYAYKKNPELGVLMDKYYALLEDMMKASGETMRFDRDHLLTSMYKDLDIEMTMDMTLWTDENGDNMRVDYAMTVATPATPDGEVVSITMPFTVQQKTDDQGVHVLMNMHMDEQDVKMSMNMLVNEYDLGGAYKADMSLGMDVQDGKDTVKFEMGGSYEQDEDGDNRNFEGELSVGADGQTVTMKLDVAGAGVLEKGEAARDNVKFSVAVEAADAERSDFALSFDFGIEQADLPEGTLLDTSDKPVVKIAEMDAEQAEKLQTELGTVGIMAYGALMQTEGIAQLLAKAMVAVQDAVMQSAPVQAPVA